MFGGRSFVEIAYELREYLTSCSDLDKNIDLMKEDIENIDQHNYLTYALSVAYSLVSHQIHYDSNILVTAINSQPVDFSNNQLIEKTLKIIQFLIKILSV